MSELKKELAKYELAIAQLNYQHTLNVQALQIQEVEAQVRWSKMRLRPCTSMGARLTRRGTSWVASMGGLAVTGDTPEMAFENFDHTWVFGTPDHLTESDDYDTPIMV
jgi:hypothetical protein